MGKRDDQSPDHLNLPITKHNYVKEGPSLRDEQRNNLSVDSQQSAAQCSQ